MARTRCDFTTVLDEHCLQEVAKQVAKSLVADTNLLALSATCKKMHGIVNTRAVWELVRGDNHTLTFISTSHQLAATARLALTTLDVHPKVGDDDEDETAALRCIPLPNLRQLAVCEGPTCVTDPLVPCPRTPG